MAKPTIKELLTTAPQEQTVEVLGWVRNRRGSKQVAFITVNDGSTIHNIQVVVDLNQISEEQLKEVHTGASVRVLGKLVPSQGSGQAVEVQAQEVEVLGPADPEKYPLQPKKHSLEFVRENAHLRARTATFGAVFRVRHHVSYAIHKFFHEEGFFYVHSPIITASDAEGAGAMFRVTTLDLKNPPLTQEGEVNFKEDFFERPTNLTVSGQLEAELMALGLGRVYTFGPTFRAENSNTTRHLAEFWMIEPEAAFYDIHDNMDLAERFVKYVIRHVLEHCADDLAFLEKRLLDEEKSKKESERSPMPLIEKLNFVVENAFERLSYTEAIELLLQSKPQKKNQFQFPVSWGIDLQAEHERYLVEKHFKKPVILTDYPKEIKAFYMKQNDDGKTVRAMDVLFPGIGEIIGGSQREEDYDKLKRRMEEVGISTEEMWWYLDTRRFGSVPHSGFGLGLERFVQFITGMGNIRDVIPFPRTPGNAEF
ncbi:asparaginyl-tRNA synthetase [Thermonema lapsum]|uniref:Asparagine--tRNA ligase n=1 Tax=Thermonema lapsum TaxID=28195 RepID=A0A846MR15_9BACT|nr:asparagine--tRNA ligase [Thermonema lapsum]NIK73899.1 asparaginyl-tRNA synthetase [Thermonema lapsum]